MKSKTLSLETIINESDFLKKISYNSMKGLNKKNFANRLIKNVPDPRNVIEHYQSSMVEEKQKISKTITNNYLSTKSF